MPAVSKAFQITGEESENKTQSRFGVLGVDLGSMAVISNTTYMFGGDTFGDEKNGRWRSNVLLLIEDDDPSDEDGSPMWVTGEEAVKQAQVVIDGPMGEISVIYNPYLGNFLITYLSEGMHAIVMWEGVTPWGNWSKPYTLATGAQYPSLYGAYMHPKYVQENGKTFYFAMSQFFPIYNIIWMRADLP